MKKEFTFYWLDAEAAAMMREQWRETGAPIGNSYYRIQYKDGRTVVFDQSYDEDKLPSLNLKDVLYVSDWFSAEAERGGFGECFINMRLPLKQVQEIILSELYDEDGNFYYDTIRQHKWFPFKEFEPFCNQEEPMFIS